MLNDRRLAAAEVAQKLFALELAIDQALVCAGELTAALPHARRRAKLSAVVGQEATEMVGASSMSLHAARAQAIAAHHSLAEVHEQIGLKVFAGGMLWKNASLEPAVPTLAYERAA